MIHFINLENFNLIFVFSKNIDETRRKNKKSQHVLFIGDRAKEGFIGKKKKIQNSQNKDIKIKQLRGGGGGNNKESIIPFFRLWRLYLSLHV